MCSSLAMPGCCKCLAAAGCAASLLSSCSSCCSCCCSSAGGCCSCCVLTAMARAQPAQAPARDAAATATASCSASLAPSLPCPLELLLPAGLGSACAGVPLQVAALVGRVVGSSSSVRMPSRAACSSCSSPMVAAALSGASTRSVGCTTKAVAAVAAAVPESAAGTNTLPLLLPLLLTCGCVSCCGRLMPCPVTAPTGCVAMAAPAGTGPDHSCEAPTPCLAAPPAAAAAAGGEVKPGIGRKSGPVKICSS
jgi:hypothetical protein